MKSKLFKLDWKDLCKSIVVFFLTSVISGLYTLSTTGNIFDWNKISGILGVSLTATISYLLKNLATNSEDEILKAEK
jgi:hypothetical protein